MIFTNTITQLPEIDILQRRRRFALLHSVGHSLVRRSFQVVLLVDLDRRHEIVHDDKADILAHRLHMSITTAAIATPLKPGSNRAHRISATAFADAG